MLHSLLASLWLKRRLANNRPDRLPGYRLFFNAAAILLVLPPVILTLSLRGDALWRWEGPWKWLALVLQLAALAGFVWSFRHYDLSEFAGLRQLRERSNPPRCIYRTVLVTLNGKTLRTAFPNPPAGIEA